MHPTYLDILTVLARYISAVNARAILTQAVKDAGGSVTQPRPKNGQQLGAILTRSVAMFVKEEVRERAAQDILVVCGANSGQGCSMTVPIQCEGDVSKARSEARRLCEMLGASTYTIQRVTTIASELARNIVSYTKGGSLDLHAQDDGAKRILLIARDAGNGISNLEEIFAGKYRSRTGLGKGIMGCRRLSDAFRIETGASGTCIEAEVRL